MNGETYQSTRDTGDAGEERTQSQESPPKDRVCSKLGRSFVVFPLWARTRKYLQPSVTVSPRSSLEGL